MSSLNLDYGTVDYVATVNSHNCSNDVSDVFNVSSIRFAYMSNAALNQIINC